MVERIQNNLKMFFISQEIRISNINKQRFNLVLTNVLGVRFLQRKQVLRTY